MAYKPLVTDLRVKAEEAGWKSLCGTEVVLVRASLRPPS